MGEQTQRHSWVVEDAGACRLIALNAYAVYTAQVLAAAPLPEPQPGDLVLEITTAFRWLGNPMAAPGEALGELLRVEKGETEYQDVYVVRPIFQADGEFQWSNCKMIRVASEAPR